MYLKSLTLLGFKSFPDKTVLNFQPGVSAIVGPNGCGKSNVSDAIRWVLGEQSARALRGSEMADVVFSGTDTRKPMGMAEVSLTLGGVDADPLRAAGVEVCFNEVTLTRRGFRDGGSEYFINRTPCRLRDIQQLFLGTGVGRASYSIMAQGNITQILSSKPEERRMVFEEAAGITRFKAQKREALRKLEATEQNLLRLADLVREVKRQIGSLQRQAGKARRYKALLAELQHLDTQLARHQFDVAQAEIAERQARADALRAEVEAGQARIRQQEEQLAALRARHQELEQRLAAAQQQGLVLQSECDHHASRIQFHEQRLRELAAQDARAYADITQAEARRKVTEEELAAVRERLATSAARLAELRQTVEDRQAALRATEAQIQRDQDALQQAQATAFAAAQDLSRVHNQINALDLLKQSHAVQLEKLSAEKQQLEEERARLEQRLGELTAALAADKRDALARRAVLAQRQHRLQELEPLLHQCTARQEQCAQALAETRSRLQVLEQLEQAHEGFSPGALAALRQSRAVLGSLADRIRVPTAYVVAIENALGHHLQLLLTERPESAQEILAELTASRAGRASVAALAIAPPEEAPPQIAAALSAGGDEQALRDGLARGEVVPALRVVQADPSVDRLLRALLGRTFIAGDLATATASQQNGRAGCDFVTLRGDLLSRHGVYTGGYLNGSGDGASPSSILGRKNQIAELAAAVAALEAQGAEIGRRRAALLAEQAGLQAQTQQEQTALAEQEVALAQREGEEKMLHNALDLLRQKIDTVVYEIQSLAARERERADQRALLEAQRGEQQHREQASQQQVAVLTASLEQRRQARDAATTALTESRVALATEEQMAASFQQQQQTLQQRVAELTQLAAQRQGDLAEFADRKAQAEAEIEESRGLIAQRTQERQAAQARVAALREQQQAAEAAAAAGEAALRAERDRLAELQEQRRGLEVELAQNHLTVQHLRERVQQKYRVNLDDVRSECITITFADEGPARVHVLSPEEMAAAGVSTDWDAVARQVESLQARLDEMGPVNLVAIEEYEETEQRYQFLSRQYDDLVQARTRLLEVIHRINTQTRQMFAETFEQIRQNFQALFTEVFGGGKADLRLLDQNDVLESGIEIVARPPGKQLQTISLLSGGEQTMTAVALLFAIYQVRPSPFCLLDELDAALDEANINRFVRILQRFLAHSQFILITHNKRTIAMADVLYGVTMEERGVSKIVSVKFHRASPPVGDRRTEPVRTSLDRPPLEEDEDAPRPREDAMPIVIAAQPARAAAAAALPAPA